jgi:xanthine dehydrogenase small subunit
MTTGAATAPSIGFLLNGRPVTAGPDAADLSLLDFVRGRGLTGAKEGCAEGECGACAVAIVVPHGQGSAYRVVNSCLVPLLAAAGHEVYTVESLAEDGILAPAQAAMAEAGGSQCGYCTPGFVMSLFAEQYRPGRQGPCDPLAMAGNLCRCTGYRPIRDAALALGPPPPGPHLDRLSRPAPRIGPARAPGFSRPSTVEECHAILAADPEAALIAGGTDLGVEVNLHRREPAAWVSLDAIDELHAFADAAAAVTIGAALPLADIGARWHDAPPAVRDWLDLFASPPIRNRATLGGNLVTASPIGDAAPLLLALDAWIHVAGADGRRSLPLSSFFTGYRQTVLARGEIVTGIEIPRPFPGVLRFYKVAKRRMDDISTVSAAIAMDHDGAGEVRMARFAFGGVAATPVRVADAEAAATGYAWTPAAVTRVQRALEATLQPMSDHRGSRAYRLGVAASLIEKFHWECGA